MEDEPGELQFKILINETAAAAVCTLIIHLLPDWFMKRHNRGEAVYAGTIVFRKRRSQECRIWA